MARYIRARKLFGPPARNVRTAAAPRHAKMTCAHAQAMQNACDWSSGVLNRAYNLRMKATVFIFYFADVRAVPQAV